MPKGLFADRPEHVMFKEYQDPPLGPQQCRLKVELGSIKHGTGFHGFSGHSPFADREFDMNLRLFVPRPGGKKEADGLGQFVGNMIVGQVIETGAEVKRFKVGERVFRYGALTETHTLNEAQGELLEPGLRAADAVCLDPGLYAYGAIRDGRVCLGDNVVLFGLGAIGQMAVQLLRVAGVGKLIAVDPVERRRQLAQTLGADLVLDPAARDVAMCVRQALGRGADLAIEASGHYGALGEALRVVGQCGRVVTIGFYKGRDSQLELGADFFHNRLELIASLPAWDNSLRDAPVWNNARLWRRLIEMFKAGQLTSKGVLDPVVDFADSATAFMRAYRDPSYALKLGVRF